MSRSLTVAALVGLALAAPSSAYAASQPAGAAAKTAAGYDVSYPQCGSAFPSRAAFGLVGVNRGIVYSANPCLGGPGGELAWAESHEPVAILYANTGDPGPALSTHWPTGQTSPLNCDPVQPDSSACSYDYGWNAAADSYEDAVDAYVSLGKLPAGATQTPQPNEWWLDVETANSWEQDTSHNVSALQGAVAFLKSQGVATVGFYASAADWRTITGDTTAFSSSPSWRPGGGGGQRTAASYCGSTGVTGGRLAYSQYSSGGYDADVRCL